MSKIPFDIKYRPQIESGEYKVETHDGHPARIICWDSPIDKDHPIIAIVYDDQIEQYKADGCYDNDYGTTNYDLFIITPEEELTEFEKVVKDRLWRTIEYSETFRKDDNKWTRELASKLLALAREQFIKDGYVIEKKAFHDAMEKVSPGVMKEVSEKIGQLDALEQYRKGREDALKDLPRWEKSGVPHLCTEVKSYSLDGEAPDLWLLHSGWKINVKSLEKLPGFKED